MLVYWVDVYIPYRNTEVLVVAVKKSGPDVNAEKNCVAISRPAGGKKLQHKCR
jgi:hypothetical protein